MSGFEAHVLRDELILRLQDDATSLPRSRMAPSLSYGRHRGPALSRSRHAAVLIAIYQDEQDRWTIPLTRRPSTLKHHGGQICLPGGQLESGESPFDAALREFEEELGVSPTQVTYCGELDTHYVYNSDNRVHPVVILLQQPRQPWNPDPVEVAEVIPMPVDALLDQQHRHEMTKHRSVRKNGREVGSFQFRASAIHYQSHQIWGATASILDQFAQVIRGELL